MELSPLTLIPEVSTPNPSQIDSFPTLEASAKIVLFSAIKLDPLYAIPVV